MASASSSTPFLGIRQENQSQVSQHHQSSTAASSTTTTSTTTPTTTVPQKKRRNQPGTPCKYLYAFFTRFHCLKKHLHVHGKYPFWISF